MTDNKFNFCPECGSRNIQTLGGGRKWLCPDCGFDLYNNVAAACGLVIINRNGEMLFERRAKDPGKGKLCVPGGFMDPDETAEETARREVLEETGVELESLSFLCTFPNTYEYKTVLYKTSDIYFVGHLPSSYEFKPQESEVQDFVWKSVRTMEDFESFAEEIAFDSARNAVKLVVEKKLALEEK